MFGNRYFGPRFFGDRFFGPAADGPGPDPETSAGVFRFLFLRRRSR
jgi:hypothetical protein